jgi:hypothetical protein
MRIAAWTLTAIAALASLWLLAYAHGYVPLVLLALFNGALALAVCGQPRRWGLWLVLAAGFLALAVTGWDHVALQVPDRVRNTHFFDVSAAGEPDDWMDRIAQWLALRRWLAGAALALTVAGWTAWLLGRIRRPAAGQG